MAMHPSRSITRRAAVGAATVVGLTLLGAGTASAHVSPDKSEVPAGAYTDVQLLVPHGCDGSPTTKIEVQVPEALTSASPYVVPGWSTEVTTEPLAEPIDDGHGGEITERDAVVSWTATAGNELPDGQRIEFGVGFQAPEEVGEVLYFKTIQTCDEGVTEWITEFDGEGEEPDHPAPAVTVGEATGDGHGHEEEGGDDATDTSEVAATPISTTVDDGDDDGSSTGIAISALVVGLAGLGLGGAAFAKSRKA